MSDRMTKPKNYRRRTCREFERICREERDAGATVVVAKTCLNSFPCMAHIEVLAGLEPACEVCVPHIPRLREIEGWKRHPAKHGEFYTSLNITPKQLNFILARIAMADVNHWLNTPIEELTGPAVAGQEGK